MGLTINVTYDSSVNSAPAAFKTVVDQVVQFYENAFNDPITININVGWGEVHGTALASTALAASTLGWIGCRILRFATRLLPTQRLALIFQRETVCQ